MTILKKRICGAGILAALLSASAFAATNFVRTDLVADSAGAAVITDPNLVGSWGISSTATSPFWVSNTATGTSTLYTVTSATQAMPTITAIVAVVPPSANNKNAKAGLPTGQVANGYGTGNFEVVATHPAAFLFATLDGTISGWRGGLPITQPSSG
jgi:uncharacterized protein (TIGR03118 family)